MNILIVHNKYQIGGGEDAVANNEYELLRSGGHNVYQYCRSNAEIKEYSFIEKLLLPFRSLFSFRTKHSIIEMIRELSIDVVHVHNTFFIISSSVYSAAHRLNVPVVQTIHNFRLICPNGILYRNGLICEECANNLLNAVLHKCYHGSLTETAMMVAILWVHRIFGTWRSVDQYI